MQKSVLAKQKKLRKQAGVEMIEVLIIVAVVILVAIVFKDQLSSLFTWIFTQMQNLIQNSFFTTT